MLQASAHLQSITTKMTNKEIADAVFDDECDISAVRRGAGNDRAGLYRICDWLDALGYRVSLTLEKK